MGTLDKLIDGEDLLTETDIREVGDALGIDADYLLNG